MGPAVGAEQNRRGRPRGLMLFVLGIAAMASAPVATAQDECTCITSNDYNCKECPSYDLSACTLCRQNYGLVPNYSGNNTIDCVQCTDPNCNRCDTDIGYCTKCIAGYAFSNGVCTLTCGSTVGCRECSIGTCTKCVTAYRLTNANTCERCAGAGCATCPDNTNTCTSCLSGFYLSGTTCQPCDCTAPITSPFAVTTFYFDPEPTYSAMCSAGTRRRSRSLLSSLELSRQLVLDDSMTYPFVKRRLLGPATTPREQLEAQACAAVKTAASMNPTPYLTPPGFECFAYTFCTGTSIEVITVLKYNVLNAGQLAVAQAATTDLTSKLTHPFIESFISSSTMASLTTPAIATVYVPQEFFCPAGEYQKVLGATPCVTAATDVTTVAITDTSWEASWTSTLPDPPAYYVQQCRLTSDSGGVCDPTLTAGINSASITATTAVLTGLSPSSAYNCYIVSFPDGAETQYPVCSTTANVVTYPPGALYCFGNGANGRLGIGNTTSYSTPVPVLDPIGTTWVEVGAGASFSCAIRSGTREVYCWGVNAAGQCGGGNFVSQTQPRLAIAGIAFKQISTGRVHACGVTTSNELYCWGSGGQYKLGNGNVANTATPTKVQDDATPSYSTTWAFVSAGFTHTCAGKTDGSIWCFGDNSNGRTGLGTNAGDTVYPTQVILDPSLAGPITFATVSAGGQDSCALDDSGIGYCWGANTYGQLGLGGATAVLYKVNKMAGTKKFSAISAANILGTNAYACAVELGTGNPYCWGRNANDSLGIGDAAVASSNLPVKVVSSVTTNIQATTLSSIAYHACVVDNTNRGLCWGLNTDGQLGIGSLVNPGDGANSVSQSPSVYKFLSLATGDSHTCGIAVATP